MLHVGVLLRILSIAEIFLSVRLIYKIINHITTAEDFVIFAAITLLFCLTAARGAATSPQARAEKRKQKGVKLDYDKEKLYAMKEKSLMEDDDEYDTNPINLHEYANKIMKGEITIDEVPSTHSKAARRYMEEEKSKKEEE